MGNLSELVNKCREEYNALCDEIRQKGIEAAIDRAYEIAIKFDFFWLIQYTQGDLYKSEYSGWNTEFFFSQ